MIEFILYGRIPSKKNSRTIIVRGKRPFSVPSSNYKKWHKKASAYIHIFKYKHSFKPEEIMYEPACDVTLVFFMPDNRKTDLTNKAESVMDLLVDTRIIIDDCWQIVNSLSLVAAGIDKTNPRCEVLIK